MSEPIKDGYCPITNEKIWDYVYNSRGFLIGKKTNELYTQINVAVSDDTVASLAISKNALPLLSLEVVKEVFERVKRSWSDSMVGWASLKQFERLRSLEVLDYDESDIKIKQKLKIKLQEKHQEKLEKKKEKDGIK